MHQQRTYSTPGLSDLDQRLRVVESFIATLQQQPTYYNAPASAPVRTACQWLKRSTHLATDMAEALHHYAKEHELEVREVHDLALREFFAHLGVR